MCWYQMLASLPGHRDLRQYQHHHVQHNIEHSFLFQLFLSLICVWWRWRDKIKWIIELFIQSQHQHQHSVITQQSFPVIFMVNNMFNLFWPTPTHFIASLVFFIKPSQARHLTDIFRCGIMSQNIRYYFSLLFQILCCGFI